MSRSRLRLRRPLPFWLLALTVAAVTGLVVSGLVGRVDAVAARWGDVRPIVVATTDIEAGDDIGAGDVVVEERPRAMLPDEALTEAPVGRRATAAIAAGEPVVAGRIAPAGVGRIAALLPPRTRGLAVPLDRAPIEVEVGDTVDLLATFDPAVSGDGDPTFTVADRALVVAVGEEAVTVAVEEREAAPVAFALANGIVTIALVGGVERERPT